MAVNILVVDDSKVMRLMLKKTLQLSGIELGVIYEASDGNEALAILKENWLDLIITDLNMPHMSGIQLIDAIIRDELLHTIPILVISTIGSEIIAENLISKGVKAFITKPFTPESIRDTISHVLGESYGN